MFLNLIQNPSFTMFFLWVLLVLIMADKDTVWDEELLDILCNATDRKKNDLKYLIIRLTEELEIELPSRMAG